MQHTHTAHVSRLEQKDEQLAILAERYQTVQTKCEELTTANALFQERLAQLKEQSGKISASRKAKASKATG